MILFLLSLFLRWFNWLRTIFVMKCVVPRHAQKSWASTKMLKKKKKRKSLNLLNVSFAASKLVSDLANIFGIRVPVRGPSVDAWAALMAQACPAARPNLCMKNQEGTRTLMENISGPGLHRHALQLPLFFLRREAGGIHFPFKLKTPNCSLPFLSCSALLSL